MLFTKDEIEILNDMNCYEDKLSLTKSEIYNDEICNYSNNNDYWDESLSDWFCNYLNKKIYTKTLNDGRELYFFDNSNDEIDCDRYELLKKLFDNYDIKDSESFDEAVVNAEDEINKKQLSKEDMEILKYTDAYDYLYDLAEDKHNEIYLEEYIASFSNLDKKFEDWFFNNEPRCVELEYCSLFFYINLDKMFYPKDKLEIIKKLKAIIETYSINDCEDFKKVKDKYIK